ncbi:MAG TPA: radical SAM protein [Verrucomicrobiales bacterium]|nr:radical SAM protein [Verrucomicrobiales bacterium]
MRIGFIALSGLRLCRTELLELGLSFPGVASRAREIEALPSLGLLTLAGLTPPSIDVEYLEVRDVDAETLPTRFDAVAISSLTATAGEAYRLAQRFRDAGVPVILGGLHASLVPGEARRHACALVIGEGEPVWSQVVRDLQRGALQSVYDARPTPFDLAASPMPRFDLLSAGRYPRYPRFTVQTQRGCPWRCEFCAASIRISPTFKVKPVERVIAEVRRLKDLFGNPFIEFADDNTFVNRAHSRRLMRALAREQVRWFTETDAGVADDEELLQLMRDAGCCQVLIGFEHPHAPALEGLELRSNWKARRADSYLHSIERIQRHGITVNGCFVLGLDGTGPESFDAVARFVERSGLYEVQITYMTPFPGTPLYRRLSEEGRILAEGASERCTLFDVNFQPDRMTLTELEEGFTALARRLYSDVAVRQRALRFRDHLRAGRKQRKPTAA